MYETLKGHNPTGEEAERGDDKPAAPPPSAEKVTVETAPKPK